MRLSQVIVFAKDVPRLRAFYVGVLGLAVVDASDTGDFVRLDAGGVVVALHAIPPAIAATIDVGDPPAPREETPIKLTFEASDVAASRARLVAAGAAMGPVRVYGERAWCDGIDPEGNVFQIASG